MVEDTEYTIDDLREMGFPEEVMDVLMLLTHRDDVPYMDYIGEISNNPTAKKVKVADLKHNSDLTRLEHVSELDVQRVKKYSKALEILAASASAIGE